VTSPLDLLRDPQVRASIEESDDLADMTRHWLRGTGTDEIQAELTVDIAAHALRFYRKGNDDFMALAKSREDPANPGSEARWNGAQIVLSSTESRVKNLIIGACVLMGARYQTYWEVRSGGVAILGFILGAITAGTVTMLLAHYGWIQP
jgi:hypothetical protein